MMNALAFLDVSNVNLTAEELSIQVNYTELLRSVTEREDFNLKQAYAYVGGLTQKTPDKTQREIDRKNVFADLRAAGCLIKSKVGRKTNMDVELAGDMVKAAYTLKPDVIILVSGDSDFASWALDFRKTLAIRVVVVAFESSLSSDFKQSYSSIVYLDDIFGPNKNSDEQRPDGQQPSDTQPECAGSEEIDPPAPLQQQQCMADQPLPDMQPDSTDSDELTPPTSSEQQQCDDNCPQPNQQTDGQPCDPANSQAPTQPLPTGAVYTCPYACPQCNAEIDLSGCWPNTEVRCARSNFPLIVPSLIWA